MIGDALNIIPDAWSTGLCVLGILYLVLASAALWSLMFFNWLPAAQYLALALAAYVDLFLLFCLIVLGESGIPVSL